MEIAPAGKILLFFAPVVIMSTGCSPAYKGNLFKIDVPAACPETIEDALAPVNTDPVNATEGQLVCALEAIRSLRPPEQRSPRAPESLEASRLCAVLAESSPAGANGAERRNSLGWEGVAWAEHAMATGLAIDPATSYYYSLNLGVAVRDSIMTAMKYLGRLLHHLERAVREDEGIDNAGPLRTLGYLLIKAPAWPAGPGDADKGLEMLNKAAKLYPDYPPNIIFLARGAWEAEEDSDTAMREATRAANLLRSRNWGVRHPAWVRELRLLLEEIDPDAAAGILEGLVDVPAAEPAEEVSVTE